MRLPEDGYSPEAWVRAVSRGIWRFVLIGLVVVVCLYVLGRLRPMLTMIFIAAILAYIMRPMANWLLRHRILVPSHWTMHARRGLATLYVLVVVFVGGYYSVKFMLSPFVHQIRDVVTNWDTQYKPQFDRYSKDARQWYTKQVPPDWRKKIEAGVGSPDMQKAITGWVGDNAKGVGQIAHYIVEIVLLPVLAFYFALDSRKLKAELLGALPRRHQREWARMIHEFNRIMHSFVVGQFILCALAGVFIGLLLWGLGVPYALTLGLLAGFTRAIPIIGPIIGGIPIIGLALLTKGMPVAITVLTIFTILHFVESKFVMPMLIGERMELHPVVIIIVLLIGAEFFGLLGMFFAAPVASLLRVIVRRYYLKNHRKRYVSLPITNGALPAAVD
jgi:predicted PurR-regulated permease PerM